MIRNNPTPVLALLCAMTMAGALAIGPIALTLYDMLGSFGGGRDPAIWSIITTVRLPRVVAAALTGLALGASGAALQALLRNPLAEPGVMGVSATAATCATGTVYFGLAISAPWLVPLTSILGACLATIAIASAGMRFRGIGTMLLTGVALSAFSGAIMALFVNLAPNPFSLSDLINWTAGSVANRDWTDIGLSAPFIMGGTILLWRARGSLSLLSLGEEAAHGLGVDLTRTRMLVVAGTGLATGGAVALAGMIGFVGLVAPHLVRRWCDNDGGRVLMPSALLAATLLVIGDVAIRLFPWGNELHLGTLAALIGAPVFAWIALRSGQVRHG